MLRDLTRDLRGSYLSIYDIILINFEVKFSLPSPAMSQTKLGVSEEFR